MRQLSKFPRESHVIHFLVLPFVFSYSVRSSEKLSQMCLCADAVLKLSLFKDGTHRHTETMLFLLQNQTPQTTQMTRNASCTQTAYKLAPKR